MKHLSSSRVPELAERHSISVGFVYKQIALGLLRARKAGNATLITSADEAAWLAAMPILGAESTNKTAEAEAGEVEA